jgi:hypothetical protein
MPYYHLVRNEADITQTNIMQLEIYIGKSNINGPVATCAKSDLLDTLRDTEVCDAIKQSLCVVRVLSEEGEELASEWYDAATDHEEGQDWDSLSEALAAKVA